MKLSNFFLLFFTVFYSIFIFFFGVNLESVSLAIKISARFSLVLFLLTFIASPIHYYFKNSFTKLILKKRSEIGISFAISHLFHLAFIFSFAIIDMPALMDGRNIAILSFGAITYGFIIIMMITSYPRFRKKLNTKSWKKLHTIGSWFIFIVFANSYMGRVIRGDAAYTAYAILIMIAFLLRIIYLINKKRAKF